MTKESEVIGSVFVATNGQLLQHIDESTWHLTDNMRVSIYVSFNNDDPLQRLMSKYPKNITGNNLIIFNMLPLTDKETPMPCRYICDGPMLLVRKLFSHGAPAVFGAADRMKKNALTEPEFSVPVAPGYLDYYNKPSIGNLESCKSCWANKNFSLQRTNHVFNEGGWRHNT